MSFGPIRRRRTSLCVGSSFQLLGILKYSCGLNLGPALTLNQNPIFEMPSNNLGWIISLEYHLNLFGF